MARRARRDRAGGNRSSGGSRRRKRREYVEQPGWGTAFRRPDNRPPQPQYTGEGVLDDELVDDIMDAGGKFQIAIWTQDSDGNPLRNKDGSRRIRVHIEPPYDPGEDDDDLDDDEDDDDQDDDEDDDDAAPASSSRRSRRESSDDDIPF